MRVAIWRSGHEIADRVADAIRAGIPKNLLAAPNSKELFHPEGWDEGHSKYGDIHIGYGILRSMDKVWKDCERTGRPFFIVDRGYWKPGHYDGYYRVSLRGTQQTGGWPEPDWERWEKLGLTIDEPVKRNGYALCCPVTDYVKDWLGDYKAPVPDRGEFDKDSGVLVREKGCTRSLDDDLAGARRVVTFNSSVGWEALRRGLPVESDPVHSIVGAWLAKHGTDKREELFAVMSACQLTLDEMLAGKLWLLMEKLLAADGR